MNHLEGRIAVVTGAAQGIGQAIAARYVREGARVALVDVDGERVSAVAQSLAGVAGQVRGYACDVSSTEDVDRCHAQIVADLGAPDVLVCNAGISRPAMSWKMTRDQWNSVLDVHVNGTYNWVQHVVPSMKANEWGRIIITTSAAGMLGSIGQINYATAKAGLLGLTRSLAKELGRFNVLVNAVAPAAATPMTETLRTDEKFNEKYLDEIPLRRWAEPEEVAGVYAFLASADSSYMTGQTIAIDGGRTMTR